MNDWYCICGNFVRDRRFCPRCKFVRLPRRVAIVCTSGHEPFVMTAAEFDVATTTIVAAATAVAAYGAAAAAVVVEEADEKTFLESIERDPFISVRKRRASLRWNDKRYYKAVDSLIQKKKIEIEKVRVGRAHRQFSTRKLERFQV